MRVVLDLNVLLISLPVASPYRPIFDALREGRFELAVSTDILLEYHEKLSEKTTPGIADNVVKLLLSLDNVILQTVYSGLGAMHNDPDDNKYVDCTLWSGSDHLVSEDRHFLILRDIGFPVVSVLRIDDFLGLVRVLP
ncbi:MAG: PIN domain-containing protein [Cytophagales bacterium]|nr:MAG: PIN domain-containing protein [Cytophagales bacterium]